MENRRFQKKRAPLTEGHDGQDDGDGDGHPGHPQGLLAVALGLMRLQAHAAFQEAYQESERVIQRATPLS